MGEYYRAVNLDRHEYLNGTSLGLSVKLDGVMESPIASLLVWLLAEGKGRGDRYQWLGIWARNRIVVAGDEGVAAELWEASHDSALFSDITIPVFEEYVNDDIFRRIQYWELGWIGDDGRSILDYHFREALKHERQNQSPPDSWF